MAFDSCAIGSPDEVAPTNVARPEPPTTTGVIPEPPEIAVCDFNPAPQILGIEKNRIPDDWQKNLDYLQLVVDCLGKPESEKSPPKKFQLEAITFPPPHFPHGIDPENPHREKPPAGCLEIIHPSESKKEGGRVFENCVSWVRGPFARELWWGWYWSPLAERRGAEKVDTVTT